MPLLGWLAKEGSSKIAIKAKKQGNKPVEDDRQEPPELQKSNLPSAAKKHMNNHIFWMALI